MDTIENIQKYGKDAQGKRDLIRHLKGERLTMKQAILSKCFDCMGGYTDGKTDCNIPDCSLYGFMPYRKDKEIRPKKERTVKQTDSTARLTLIRSVARKKQGYSI
jgi:hypothetical protein